MHIEIVHFHPHVIVKMSDHMHVDGVNSLGFSDPKLVSSDASKMYSMEALNFLKVGLSSNSSTDSDCWFTRRCRLSFFFFLETKS